MTSNWNEFEKYVIKKFGKISEFARALNGDARSMNSYVNMTDSEANRIIINALLEKAKEVNYDKTDYRISDTDRRVIRGRMLKVVEELNLRHQNRRHKVVDVLRHNNITHSYYSGVIYGHILNKDNRYDKLISALEL